MANYTKAIFETCNSIVTLLVSRMQSGLKASDICLFSPGIHSDEPMPNLGLFLYQLREDPNYVNSSDSQCALELFMMLIPNSTNTGMNRAMDEHKWLGDAMNVLHENPVLKVPELQGELINKNYQIRITHNPVSLDDLTKIWQSLQPRPFKLSVCYRVGPVFIESEPKEPAVAVRTVILGQ
jgi:hypothetical protein